MPAGMVCGIAALAAVLPLIAQDARPSVGRTWPLMSGDLPRTKAVPIRSLSFRLRVRRELIGNARMKDRYRGGMVVVGTHSGPLFVEVRDPALRHSREITRVCSRRVTHRPNGAGDDNALPICGLRAKVRCRGWATLSEHKWSSFGERRGVLGWITGGTSSSRHSQPWVQDGAACGNCLRRHRVSF